MPAILESQNLGDLLNGLFRPERIYVVEPPG